MKSEYSTTSLLNLVEVVIKNNDIIFFKRKAKPAWGGRFHPESRPPQ